MKPLTITFCMLGMIMLTAFQSDNSCDSYFPQQVGSKWEFTSYNEKDKIVSVSKSRLVSVSDIADGLEAVINIETVDDKGKTLTTGDVRMQCTSDKFYMDMTNLFPKEQMSAMKDAEVEITNGFMEFPSNPVAGQTLPDAESTMTMTVSGMQMMSMTLKTTNRKIEGFEQVSTPAGTYQCVKYSSDTEVQSMMFKTKSHSITYLAKNIGTVKMESYDEKGKLQSKSMLTAFSN